MSEDLWLSLSGKPRKPRRRPAAKVGDLVAVTWTDAWFDEPATTPDQWKDDCPMVTYGRLMRKGPIVTVAGEDAGPGEYRSVSHIPRGMVKRIRRIT